MPKHGGNIYQNPECSAEWLDFSANINPFGVPETVQHAIQRAVAALVHYPDPAQQKLRQALAEFHGKLPAEIVCGNGGADVIFRIAHALKPQHALLPVPTFSEYEAALREAGCYVTHWNMPFPYQITPALNQDAVDVFVGVELGNLGEKFLLRRFSRHSKFERTDARIRASLDFVAHINLAG